MRIREAWTAAQVKPYNVAGNFVAIRSATGLTDGSVDIRFWYRGQSLPVDMIGCDPGDKVSIPGPGFDYMEVTSAVAQTLDLKVLRGDAGSDRITGNVSIISGELARVKSGVAFLGGGYQAAVGGQISHVQLWNPAGATRRIVTKLTLGALVATSLYIGRNAAQLANASALFGASPLNKLSTGAASTSLNRMEANAAAIGTALAQAGVIAGYVPFVYTPTEPLILEPGSGVIVRNSVANADVLATWDFWEEPV